MRLESVHIYDHFNKHIHTIGHKIIWILFLKQENFIHSYIFNIWGYTISK